MQARSTDYLRTITRELEAQRNRVRDIIGNAHWYHDGAHKESILAAVLMQFLPYGIFAKTGFGFVGDNQGMTEGAGERWVSREQDIVVYDCFRGRPLFETDGLVICDSSDVIGAVSVKSGYTMENLRDALDCLLSLARICSNAPPAMLIFFFHDEPLSDTQLTNACKHIAVSLQSYCQDCTVRGKPSQAQVFMTTLGGDFIKASTYCDPVTASAFRCGELGAAFGIGWICDSASGVRGRNRAPIMEILEHLDFPKVTQYSASITTTTDEATAGENA